MVLFPRHAPRYRRARPVVTFVVVFIIGHPPRRISGVQRDSVWRCSAVCMRSFRSLFRFSRNNAHSTRRNISLLYFSSGDMPLL